MAPFQHKPLAPDREIRLLGIKPGNITDPLACELLHVSLKNKPEYEALSYTWGDPNHHESITCNGTEVFVTTSLFSALRRLRLTDRDRMLWADAICINQQDQQEVGQQVSMMGDIYSSAKQVVVYLGDDHPGDERAFELLDILAAARERTRPNADEGSYRVLDPGALRELGVPSMQAPEWISLAALFGRPYFGRMWIQQEVALSSEATVFCGKTDRPWKHIADAAMFLLDNALAQDLEIGGIGSCARIESYRRSIVSGRATAYYGTLQGCRNSGCANPRDKIYALLGMITEPGDRFDIIDYSAPVADVYSKFTTFMINKENSIKIIGAREDPLFRTRPELPSWVADWTVECLTRQLGLMTEHAQFRTAGDTIPRVSLLDRNVLSVRGAIMDTVKNVGSYFQARLTGVDDIAVPHDWEEMLFGGPSYPTGEDKPWVFLNILTCAKKQLGFPFLCWLRQVHGLALSDEVEQQSETELAKYSRFFLFNVMESSNGTSFLTTTKGYAGTGPPSTKPQDLVCILDGGPMPFILRPTRQDTHCYELIGECYIQGIMDGEAVAAGDLSYQDFLLC